METVLVTGGCGFIGSNLLNYLVEKYPAITWINIDKLDYCATENNVVVSDAPNYIFLRGDLTNEAFVTSAFEKYPIDAVIHLAAQSHVDNSFENAVAFIQDNIIATYTLLKCSQQASRPIQRFIHVSTDEVYGETEVEVTENAILDPTNPYAASKTSAEYFVKTFYKCYGLPIIITRGNNVYGPRQFPEKLIPKFIRQVQHGEQCTVHGEGHNIRSFIHVEDVCRAFEVILLNGVVGQVYNIGTNNEYSVMEIAERIIHRLRPEADVSDYVTHVPDRPWNDIRYAISAKKLRHLGWSESIPFERGFDETIDWYLQTDCAAHWSLTDNRKT